MFKRVLIANRGEIARRIIRTCDKLGIETVAIYSEADQHSLHVREATTAYEIGKPPVKLSYLNINKILEIAKQAKVDAIHPGYGLLSENPLFAKKVEDSGITFIGPKSDVIAAMGSKLEARKLMERARIPIIKGNNTAITTVEEAIEVAKDIGYPLMLKASAGGGGIGMQIINDEMELQQAFNLNQQKANNFFGDNTMFMEQVINNAHHIEVQILADYYGNVVPIFERECSIQRRNQKVIEEAPSPYINEETRQKLLDSAVKAAKFINYTNAGTIEFLVDDKQNFYFLEMNTRLQVEHTVTEEISGLDLVEQQLKIAAGHMFNLIREHLHCDGHSIEVRIYAEDPVSFYPSPGKITSLSLPEGKGIRHEIAVESGSIVSPFYDPMIGKLIVKGSTRQEACSILACALENYRIEGIKTNIPMLLEMVTHHQFLLGITNTHFVDEFYLPTKRMN